MCRARSLVPLDHRRGRDFQSLHRGLRRINRLEV